MNSMMKAFPFAAGIARDTVKGFVVYLFETPGRSLDLLTVWENRLRQRSALTHMDQHLLEDMGLTPEDAAKEAAKPFWRA